MSSGPLAPDALHATHPKIIIVNGELVPFERGTAHLMSPGVRYGLNVFEGLRGYWIESKGAMAVFRLSDHMQRLWQSMRLLRFEPEFTIDEVTRSLFSLLDTAKLSGNCHIRVSAYLDGFGDHSVPGPVSYFVSAQPAPRSKATQSGIRCAVSSWTRIDDTCMPPRIKTGANYVNVRLARFQAKRDGYDDAILLNSAGKVAETPGAAIFVCQERKVVTPDVTSGILESITRDTIICLARSRNFIVEERPLDRTELYTAEEVFLAGTAAEIVPVIDVDGLRVGTGEVGATTKLLQRAYFDLVEGRTPGPREWLDFFEVR